MRSTSSGRKRGTALVLCAALTCSGGVPPAAAAERPVPALLLRFASPDIPEEQARARLAPMGELLRKGLDVSWVALPPPAARAEGDGSLPEAGATEIAVIARELGEAARRMDGMETEEAARRLGEAERVARSRRADGSMRPYLAEIFLRRGLLLLWEGNSPGAEDMFARARALRPDFSPDPALFPPSFREAWARAASRPAPAAEVLVRSIPSGADISVGGEKRGVTPARVRLPTLSPVRVRVSMPGYAPVERLFQRLPGDSEVLDLTLRRDPAGRIEELLAARAAGGAEAGTILSAMAAEAGAERVAVLVLAGEGPEPGLSVLAMVRGEAEPSLLGEFPWPAEEGEEGAEAVASKVAALLNSAGWPANSGTRTAGTSWYHRWWVWALLGAAAAGLAAAAGGSGGGSGGSAGAISVNF